MIRQFIKGSFKNIEDGHVGATGTRRASLDHLWTVRAIKHEGSVDGIAKAIQHWDKRREVGVNMLEDNILRMGWVTECSRFQGSNCMPVNIRFIKPVAKQMSGVVEAWIYPQFTRSHIHRTDVEKHMEDRF